MKPCFLVGNKEMYYIGIIQGFYRNYVGIKPRLRGVGVSGCLGFRV